MDGAQQQAEGKGHQRETLRRNGGGPTNEGERLPSLDPRPLGSGLDGAAGGQPGRPAAAGPPGCTVKDA